MTRRSFWVAMAVVGVLVAQASATNLLVNGGFDDGDTGAIGSGFPGWGVWGNSGWHHDDAGKVIGSKAIKFWWDDSGTWQDVAVVAGQQYEFSVMAFNASGDALHGWNGNLTAQFFDAGGTDESNRLLSVVVDKFYSASDPMDQWVLLSGEVTAPAGAVTGRIQLNIADWQSGVGGSLNFDDASITAVPEPASLLLIGLAFALTSRRNTRG